MNRIIEVYGRFTVDLDEMTPDYPDGEFNKYDVDEDGLVWETQLVRPGKAQRIFVGEKSGWYPNHEDALKRVEELRVCLGKTRFYLTCAEMFHPKGLHTEIRKLLLDGATQDTCTHHWMSNGWNDFCIYCGFDARNLPKETEQ